MQKHMHVVEGEPEPSTSEAETETPIYDDLLDELDAEVKQITFTILIWGPSVHAESVVAEKRREIYDRLLAGKHRCKFGEELKRPPEVNLQALQLKHGRAADLIVLLVEASAPGAIGEMHDFCKHKELLAKMLIFYPEEMKHGYNWPALVRDIAIGFRNVEYYQEIDIISCNVRTTVLKWIEARQYYEYCLPVTSRGRG